MSDGNKIDKAIEKAKKHPWASGLTAVFGAAALSTPTSLAIGVGAISPVLTARETVVGAVNLFRDRSKLSKVFSAASAATGIAAGVGFASAINAPGWDGLMAFFMTSAGMIATSTLNVAAHYTRNIGIDLKLKMTSKNNDEDNDNTPPAP